MNVGDASVILFALVLTGLLAWFFFGPRKSIHAQLEDGYQVVRVTVKGGYHPDLLEVRPGTPVRMVFDRQESGDALREWSCRTSRSTSCCRRMRRPLWSSRPWRRGPTASPAG